MNRASHVRLSCLLWRSASGKLVDESLERAGSSSERVGDSLLVDVETQFVPWLLVVTQSHKLDRSLVPEPLALVCEPTHITMEEAVRALQQQVNALMSQNAALEAQLISQQNIAQGLAELPGAITTVLSRSQAPMRRILVDPKGLGKPPMFSGTEEDFYVWTKKIENYVSGVFPNVRGALGVCS